MSVADAHARRAGRPRSRAARRSPARRATPTSTDPEGVALRRASSRRRSPRARSRRSTRARRSRCPACSRCSRHENAPELAGRRRRAGGAPVGRASPTAARSSRPWSPRRSRRRAQAAQLVRVDYDAEPHDVELRADHPGLYKPDKVNPNFPTDTERGRRRRGARAAPRSPSTRPTRRPAEHNNPMEPHATIAVWEGGGLTLYDSNQGACARRAGDREGLRARPRAGARDRRRTSAAASARRARRGRTSSLAAMAAKHVGRPVKLAVTRQQMFALDRLPHADHPARSARRRRATAGCTAIAHDVVEQTSTVQEFAEQTAVVHADDVRGAEPAHDAPAGRARRADAVVDARAGRVPGHVRARVGDGRARDRVRHRPDRAAHPQRARRSTRRAATRSRAATSSPACARAPSGSAGRIATRRRRRAATAAG